MIISLWAIIAAILCIWLICKKKNFLGLPWLVLGCVLIYTFLPLILFIALIYGCICLYSNL